MTSSSSSSSSSSSAQSSIATSNFHDDNFFPWRYFRSSRLSLAPCFVSGSTLTSIPRRGNFTACTRASSLRLPPSPLITWWWHLLHCYTPGYEEINFFASSISPFEWWLQWWWWWWWWCTWAKTALFNFRSSTVVTVAAAETLGSCLEPKQATRWRTRGVSQWWNQQEFTEGISKRCSKHWGVFLER